MADKTPFVFGAVHKVGDTTASASSVDGTTLKFTPPRGYYDGTNDKVVKSDANFDAANIKSGTDIFGITGSMPAGPANCIVVGQASGYQNPYGGLSGLAVCCVNVWSFGSWDAFMSRDWFSELAGYSTDVVLVGVLNVYALFAGKYVGSPTFSIMNQPFLTRIEGGYSSDVVEYGGATGVSMVTIWGCPLLTYIDSMCLSGLFIGVSGQAQYVSAWIFAGNALDETTVDNLIDYALQLASTYSVTGKALDLQGGTNAVPSATGLANIATLVGTYGWSVYYNS